MNMNYVTRDSQAGMDRLENILGCGSLETWEGNSPFCGDNRQHRTRRSRNRNLHS
jgi:hypothetical protein